MLLAQSVRLRRVLALFSLLHKLVLGKLAWIKYKVTDSQQRHSAARGGQLEWA